jgi:hypothetical protein
MDKGSGRFSFSPLEEFFQQLQEIDQGAGKYLITNETIVNPQTRDKYLISSLINEAITSSRLEGAVTAGRRK